MIESVWEQNVGQLFNQLDPDTKKPTRKLEAKKKKPKLIKKEISVIFNKIFINYIYIYIYMRVCVCVCVCPNKK